MSNFDIYLTDIAQDTRPTPDNIYAYGNDFKIVRDYVFNILCQTDSNFADIFDGGVLFGSYANDLRIHCPSEFDVQMNLNFPFFEYIYDEDDDGTPPGYLSLNFGAVNDAMDHHLIHGENYEHNYDEDLRDFITDYLTDNGKQLLNRKNLVAWLFNTFRSAFRSFGNKVSSYDGSMYTLKFCWRGVAFTVWATAPIRRFVIDFVPAIRFNSQTRGGGWHAVPKTLPGYDPEYIFFLCNSEDEKKLLLKGGNKLKAAIRLLQSLRNKKDLKKLRCYYLVTAALWELKKLHSSFWKYESLSRIFIHMLDVVSGYFANGYLPFYWDADLNLLRGFSSSELEHYEQTLCGAYNTLSSYYHQPNLSAWRCYSHFDLV